MNVQRIPTAKIRPNPVNPRVIRDDRFAKLVQSIREFPEMLDLRPIVLDADGMVLGGNMRLRACKEAGLREVPVVYATSLTPEQQKEFVIKDNVGYGDWDWDVLANEWDLEQLQDWGLAEVAAFSHGAGAEERELDLDRYAQSADTYLNNTIRQVVLHYDRETHANVLHRLSSVSEAIDARDDNSAAVLALLEHWEATKK